jgi:hypothetical protein
MKWAIIQYCWVRPFTSFAAVIMNWVGIYCEQSWSPRFGSVWVCGASLVLDIPKLSHIDFNHRVYLRFRGHVLFDPTLHRHL